VTGDACSLGEYLRLPRVEHHVGVGERVEESPVDWIVREESEESEVYHRTPHILHDQAGMDFRHAVLWGVQDETDVGEGDLGGGTLGQENRPCGDAHYDGCGEHESEHDPAIPCTHRQRKPFDHDFKVMFRLRVGAGSASDGIRLVQLRLRLGLVPVRPRRDVLQFRFEEVVQELLLGVLHLGEDLACGRWASLPVARLSRSRGLERLLGFSFERFHRTVREYRKGRGKYFLGLALVSM